MTPARTVAAVLMLGAVSLQAQATRRLTTIDALRQFPGYYHLQPVLVRGELVENGSRVMLRTDEHEIRLLLDRGTRASAGPVELRGILIDVGKLQPGDGRLASYERPVDAAWPKPGEELLLQTSSITPFTAGAPLSMRTLVLEPWRFEGQSITLTGQFRGRNLFGDLPAGPKKSQYDFVLKSGEGAVWIAGMRPRGRGFNLNVDARIDTSQWLEVTGVVKRTAGLVTIEATRLNAASEVKSTEREEAAPPPPPPPPVEVVFSAPTPGEIDVPATTTVRVQFSRNIKPETLKNHFRVTYAEAGASAAAPSAPIDIKTQYDAANRALELTFPKPLDKLRTVKIDILDGVLAFDGAPIVPWSMTFVVAN